MFFYWYGKETGVWISNQPLHTPHVDCRMKYNIRKKWIDRGDFQHLIGERNDFVLLIAYLSGRLPEEHRSIFVRLVHDTFSIDMDQNLKFAKDLLKMFNNKRPVFN
jgi:hypothetical protein